MSQSSLPETFVGEWFHVDSLPLLGLSDLGQIFKTIFGSLEGLGSGFVGPLIWSFVEPSAGAPVGGAVVNETEEASLHTEFPFSLSILDRAGSLIEVEFLVLVLLDPLLDVARDGRPSSPPTSGWPPAVLASEHERSVLLGGFLEMKVHASSWLHGGSMWLVNLSSELWYSVAINYFNIELNIRVKWDWLSTEWGLGESTTVGVV